LPDIHQRLTSTCLLCIGTSQLIYLHLQINEFGLLSIAALLLLVAIAAPRLQLRERILLTLALLLTIIAWFQYDSPLALFQRAGLQAAFLTAFMVMLSLLRDGAVSSASVLGLGKFLTSRSPGRRYLAIHSGAQLLGMVLNFGALTLLGPLIQRGARSIEAVNAELAKWREQRQLSALVRGFSWTVAWSPATVSMAITISVVQGANLLVVCLYGIAASAGSLITGWLLDRNTGRAASASLATGNPVATPVSSETFPWTAARRLTLVCLALFLVTATVIIFNQSRIVTALMLASPVVTLIWLVAQHRNTQSGTTAFRGRLRDIAIGSVPAGMPEAITLASAGYIGVTAVALVNAVWVAEVTGITELTEPWLYLMFMASVPILSNLALPPILSVTVLGGLYSTLNFDGIDPDLLACSLIWGWALNLTGSPFGGVPLILGRITGISSTRLSWRWNGSFSLIMFLWCSLLMTILASR